MRAVLCAVVSVGLSSVAVAQLIPPVEWIRQFGGRDHEWIHAVEPDGSGGVFYGGESGSSSSDAIVGRFTSDGELAWSTRFDFSLPGQSPFGESGATVIGDVQVDAAGNLYVLGGGDPDLTHRPFAGKLDTNGNLQWTAKTELNSDYIQWESAVDMAVDHSGNVFMGGEVLHADANIRERFISMFNADGELQWTNRGLPDNFGDVLQIFPDDDGGTYVYGARLATGDTALTLAMIDASGNLAWSRETGIAFSIVPALTASDLENFYVLKTAGTTQSPVYSVSKVDELGEVLWTSEPLPLARYSELSIEVDDAGRVVVAGSLPDRTTVLMLDGDGDVIWTHLITAEREDSLSTIAVDSLGNVFLGGNRYYIDYDQDDDVRDALVMKLSVAVPEPSSIALASLGLGGLLAHRFRRQRCRQLASRTT